MEVVCRYVVIKTFSIKQIHIKIINDEKMFSLRTYQNVFLLQERGYIFPQAITGTLSLPLPLQKSKVPEMIKSDLLSPNFRNMFSLFETFFAKQRLSFVPILLKNTFSERVNKNMRPIKVLICRHTTFWLFILTYVSIFLTTIEAWLFSKEHNFMGPSHYLKKEEPKPINSSGNYGEKLILTDYLASSNFRSGELIWKELARVSNITDVLSYSGFFTVNQEFNSNLFFWFFPAAYNAESAPVLLWLNGGPGTSSMFGLFVENGPFMINDKGFLDYRAHAWTMTHNILYIDSPVGTGFSFTTSERGYARSQEQVAGDLYEALLQFFRVFPEFINNDFFIAGESYAGKYVPSLAFKIHNENRLKNRKMKLALKGIMIGSGYSDPINQNEYGDYLYNIGLIDTNQRAIFYAEEDSIRKLIRAKKWREATDRVQNLILGYPDRPSYFHNITDFKFYMNVLETITPVDYKSYANFLSEEHVRKAIHVGDQPFLRGSITVLTHMIEDICKSVRPQVEKLLNEEYRVLIYAPQLDIIVPHTGIDKFVRNLKWDGAEDYDRSIRSTWRVNEEIAGYVKQAKNLIHVTIRNAGHVSSYDQPVWTFDMVNRFTRGLPFY